MRIKKNNRQNSLFFRTLTTDLEKHFDLHLARAKCFAFLVIGLLKLRTVNLWLVAQAFGGLAKLDSSRKRAKRFVSQVSLSYERVAIYVVKVMQLFSKESWVLAMDRTNWRFGKADINILYLSIAFKRVALPLFLFCSKVNRVGTQSQGIG